MHEPQSVTSDLQAIVCCADRSLIEACQAGRRLDKGAPERFRRLILTLVRGSIHTVHVHYTHLGVRV